MSETLPQQELPEDNPWPAGRHVAIYLAAMVATGLFGGWLWHELSTPPNYTIGDDRGAIITEQGLSQAFAMDIWYVIISLLLALAFGVLTMWLFHRVGWLVALIAMAGAVLAGVICWQFGHLLGPRDFAERISQAKPGDRVPMDLDLHSAALLLIWPFAANVPILLWSLWSVIHPRRR